MITKLQTCRSVCGTKRYGCKFGTEHGTELNTAFCLPIGRKLGLRLERLEASDIDAFVDVWLALNDNSAIGMDFNNCERTHDLRVQLGLDVLVFGLLLQTTTDANSPFRSSHEWIR